MNTVAKLMLGVIVGIYSSLYADNNSQYADNNSQYAENSSQYAENISHRYFSLFRCSGLLLTLH